MAVVVIQEFVATVEQYDQVTEKVDGANNPPDGLIAHAGVDAGGGKVAVYDIWETAEAFEKFAEERLGPIVGEVLGEDAAPPKLEIKEARDVATG
jgi:hypothetical protein